MIQGGVSYFMTALYAISYLLPGHMSDEVASALFFKAKVGVQKYSIVNILYMRL